jgi:hypothetical protein
MKTPKNFSRYVSPKEREENRARIRAFIAWSAAGLALFLLAMMYAYTDQAPPWLREFAFKLDGLFGFPVLALIKAITA